MDFDTLAQFIGRYRLVIRPTVTGGYAVAVFKSITVDGKQIEVWKKTYTEAHELEDAVRGCIAKVHVLGRDALAYPAPND